MQFLVSLLPLVVPAEAVSVYETKRGLFVRRALIRLGSDCAFAQCPSSGGEPLFPFLWALWFPVGVQEHSPAEWALTVLRPEETECGRSHGGTAPASPTGPVLRQGRIIG